MYRIQFVFFFASLRRCDSAFIIFKTECRMGVQRIELDLDLEQDDFEAAVVEGLFGEDGAACRLDEGK